MIFVTGDITAEAADAFVVSIDSEAACFKVARVRIPDDDVAGADAGLLQAFADGPDKRGVSSAAAA